MSQAIADIPSPIVADDTSPLRSFAVFLWAAISAFGTYFCMYGVRVPFKVATFSDVAPVFGIFGFKTILLTAQVLGYTISKFIGIRFTAEMKPQQRAAWLVILVSLAELALVGFGILPTPWNAALLFFNGLPLGMVFGLVMGFLEGRRHSEAMLAGLCCSFIAADGVTKGLGKWVMEHRVSEFWMPAVTGSIFLAAMLGFVWALRHIPRPNAGDIQARSRRDAMARSDRLALFWKYAVGLTLIMIGYLLLTILRSVRGDFASEIWDGLGFKAHASSFAASEIWVAVITLLLFAGLIFIRSNRRAFFISLLMSVLGFALGAVALLGQRGGWIGPFPFIVLLGIGMYMPYMAVHTTLFERLLAVTRDKGNIAYLMYLVDSFGYLGYVAFILGKSCLRPGNIVPFFLASAWWSMLGGMVVFTGAAIYFARHPKVRRPRSPGCTPGASY